MTPPAFDAVRREIQLEIKLASASASQWRVLAQHELAVGDADGAAEYNALGDEEEAIANAWRVALRAIDHHVGLIV